MFVGFDKIRVFLWLALFLGIRANERVKVEKGVYKDLVVSFSSRLSPENGEELVLTTKEILNEVSSILQTAIGLRIGSVIIRLPHTWNASRFEPEGRINPSEPGIISNIRIENLTDSAFGNFPYASQYGGCGVPGREIIIPDVFLKNGENNHTGKILAREWLKYQYGVFDENGFKNDDLYPSYFNIPGSGDWHITDCTSPKVEYTFRDSKNKNCTLKKDTECSIYPEDESSENATSSLMFFHEKLLSVNHVCEKDTHNQDSLNKQNLLCNYRSILEVIEKSGDLSSNVKPQESHEIEFSYAQESKLQFIVAVETTKNLQSKGQSIKRAVQKLVYNAPLQSNFGLLQFIGNVSTIIEFPEPLLTEKEIKFTNDFIRPNDSTAIGLTHVLEVAIQKLTSSSDQNYPGTIVIVTASNPSEKKSTIRELENSKLRLVVIGLNGTLKEKWDKYLDVSRGSFWEIEDSADEAVMFHNLYKAFDSVLPVPADDSRKFTIKTSMIPLDGEFVVPFNSAAKSFTFWIFRNVLKEDGLKCKIGLKKFITLSKGPEKITSDFAFFSFDAQAADVECNLNVHKQTELLDVQMITKQGAYVQHAAWHHDTTSEESENQMPVIIYAQIYYGQYPIQNATVKANVTKRSQNSDGNENWTSIDLFDDGRGDPDITKNDGIYSRYFIEFESEGEYDVIVTAHDNNMQARIGKNGESPCCGSKVVSESADLDPFEVSFSTSFTAKSKKPETGYEPSRVTDLKVENLNLPDSVTLTWTAPGGELDQGQASTYEFLIFCNHEDCKDGLTVRWIDFTKKPKPQFAGSKETLTIEFLENTPGNVTISFTLKAINAHQQNGETSNRVSLKLPPKYTQETTTHGTVDDVGHSSHTVGNIIAYVIIGIALVIIVVGLIFFFSDKARQRRKLEDLNTPDAIKYPDNNSANVFKYKSPPLTNEFQRTESFPVMLYTHDQIKDFKGKRKDDPQYDSETFQKPWGSTSALISDEINVDGRRSLGISNSTISVEENKNRLDNNSQISETQFDKNSKF